MKKTKKTDKQAQIDELKTKYARAMADYQNLEKRFQAKQEQLGTMITASIISRFIGVLDNLERAAKHIDDPGLNMVLSEFARQLEEENVTEVKALDQVFDASKMECVDLIPGEKDVVLSVELKGYQINDHLIRPAKVKVGNGQNSGEESADTQHQVE